MNVRKLTVAALFAALCCVATAVVQIPVPTAGYIHFGDVFVLLSGWLLGGWGVAAAGIGSMLADLFTGYVAYAPITFLDKAAVAAAAWLIYALFKKLLRKKQRWVGLIVSSIIGELIMAAGYIAYEWVLYGFGSAILNLVPYLIKGAVSLTLACLLYPLLNSVLVRVGIRQRTNG